MVPLLKKSDILTRHMLSNSSLYEAIQAGEMTPAVKMAARKICAWPEHESDLILRAKIAGKTKNEIRALVADLIEKRKSGGAQ